MITPHNYLTLSQPRRNRWWRVVDGYLVLGRLGEAATFLLITLSLILFAIGAVYGWDRLAEHWR